MNDSKMTLDQINKELSDLLLVADRINIQLGDGNKLNSNGERMSDEEYNQWRNRARFAKLKTETKRRKLKVLAKSFHTHEAFANFKVVVDDPVSLLAAIYRMLNTANKENRISLQEEEWNLLNITLHYLQKEE